MSFYQPAATSTNSQSSATNYWHPAGLP